MGYQTKLPEALKRFGVEVVEVNGWRDRGRSTFTPRGGLNHHTAGPRSGMTPSLKTVTEGRPGLPGPLCNVLGSRDLKAYVVAAGKANHGGVGSWNGVSGNSYLFGLEMEHTGVFGTEGVTADLIEFMARVQAAFAWLGGYTAANVAQHWEYAQPPGRKIDFVKGHLDPVAFRGRVATLLRQGGGTQPQPTNPSEDWFDMATEAQLKKIVGDEVNRVLGPVLVDIKEQRENAQQESDRDGSTRAYLFALAEALGHPREALAQRAREIDKADQAYQAYQKPKKN